MTPMVSISLHHGTFPELTESLNRFHPQGGVWGWGSDLEGPMRLQHWRIDLPLDDEVTQHALRTLRRKGLVSGPEDAPRHEDYRVGLFLRRRFSAAEWSKAKLLVMHGSLQIESSWRIPNSPFLRFPAKFLRNNYADTIRSLSPGLVVPQRVRVILEEQGYAELEFREVHPTGRRGSKMEHTALPWEEVGEPWWELRSSVRLPPLSPSVPLTTTDGSPFRGYDVHCLQLRDPTHLGDPLLRYRAEDLDGMPPFDFAMTHEHMGRPPDHEWMVVSQRVRKLFRTRRLRAKWNPVIIED